MRTGIKGLALLIAWTWLSSAHGQEKEAALLRHEASALCMGTKFHCVLYGKEQAGMVKAADAAFQYGREMEQLFSDYLEDSELNLLCQSAPAPRKTSDELFEVLQWSIRLAEFTNGAFDPTVGHMSRIWRRAKRRNEMPGEAEIIRALSLANWRNLELDAAKRTARVSPGTLLDLGAIAKGWTAEAMLKKLAAAGYPQALVACSGDIAAGAAPPNEKGWRVAIRPFGDSGESAEKPAIQEKIVFLTDCSVSTSGAAFQYFEYEGKKQSHLIDPRTGRALTVDRACAVIAPRGAVADALATACCVLGTADALPKDPAIMQGVTIEIWNR